MVEVLERSVEQFTNYAELESASKKLINRVSFVHGQSQSLQQEARGLEQAQELVGALMTSWQQDDPGKYGLSVSFVGPEGYPAVAVEFLPPDAVLGSRRQTSYDHVLRKRCPRCRQMHPLLWSHQQTYDGPDGDEWLARVLLLCWSEELPPQIIELHRKESGDRIWLQIRV